MTDDAKRSTFGDRMDDADDVEVPLERIREILLAIVLGDDLGDLSPAEERVRERLEAEVQAIRDAGQVVDLGDV